MAGMKAVLASSRVVKLLKDVGRCGATEREPPWEEGCTVPFLMNEDFGQYRCERG
jgi:hypothetical protein